MKQFPCCWISLNFYSLCPWLEMPFRSTGTNAPAIPCHSPYWPETCLVLKRKCIDLYNTSCEQKPKLGKFSLFLRSSTFHFLWLQRKVADKCNFISSETCYLGFCFVSNLIYWKDIDHKVTFSSEPSGTSRIELVCGQFRDAFRTQENVLSVLPCLYLKFWHFVHHGFF